MLGTHLDENDTGICIVLPFLNERGNFYIGWGRKKSGRKAQHFAAKHGTPFYLLEDGFIRSLHTPKISKNPLSIVIDDVGIYYDAREPSRLENILQSDKTYSEEDLERARRGIDYLRTHKISKYNHAPDTPSDDLPNNYILLIDQTYGDLSITGALADESDFKTMLDTAMTDHPNTPIALKIHPQTINGRKRGYLYNAYQALPKDQRKNIHIIAAQTNPFTLIELAKEVYTVSSQMGFEALLCGKPVRCFGMPFYAGWGLTLTRDEKTCGRRTKKRSLEEIFAAFYFDYSAYFNPLNNQLTSFENLVSLMTLWRDHNQAHQSPAACLHISRWKRPAMNVFLGGANSTPKYFMDEIRAIAFAQKHSAQLYVWSSRMSENLEAQCAAHNITLIRIEDGFLRSKGLGAQLTPPCSLCFDDVGIYYDARAPSRLENILNTADIDDKTIARAEALRAKILESGLSKYNLTTAKNNGDLTKKIAATRAQNQTIILVPGQVEDDASVLYGGDNIRSNLDLLEAVRAKNSNAFIIYKPHPDVMAGLRTGHTAQQDIDKFADATIADQDIITLINISDEVHINTSLAGFEALLRDKPVHTYGTPFYAGWGLTHDTTETPRRTHSRTLSELIAATLILYPSYIHPRAMIPCRAEDIADYLSNHASDQKQTKTICGKIYSAFGAFKTVWRKTK